MLIMIVCCFIAALTYSYYPVLAKQIGLEAMWIAVLINTGGLGVTGVWHIFQKNPQHLSPKQIILGLGVGVIAGIGTIFYSKLMTLKGVDLSIAIPIMLALMPIMLAILAHLSLGEQIFTLKKILALLMVSVSIYLLTTK